MLLGIEDPLNKDIKKDVNIDNCLKIAIGAMTYTMHSRGIRSKNTGV